MSTVMAYLQDLPVQIVYMVMNKLEKAGVTFALMMTNTIDDNGEEPHGIGTYVSAEQNDGRVFVLIHTVEIWILIL